MWVSLASIGSDSLDPSSDDKDDDHNTAAGNGASIIAPFPGCQPVNNDDESQIWDRDGTTQVLSQCSDEEEVVGLYLERVLQRHLDSQAEIETQVGDDYDAAEEQAGVEFLVREVTAQERPDAGFMPPTEQAVASGVPPARQLLPHTKRGQGPVERASLSDPSTPSSPSYSPRASPDNSRPASPETEAGSSASTSYSPRASPDYSPQASPR